MGFVHKLNVLADLLLLLDLLLRLGFLDAVGPDAVVLGALLVDLHRLADETVPLVKLLDLGDLAAAEVSLNALLAEGVGTGVTAEEVAALSAPGAELVVTLLIFLPLTTVVKLATPAKLVGLRKEEQMIRKKPKEEH